MHTVEEALAALAGAAGPPRRRVERVALGEALGRVLAADVVMDHDVPDGARAAMDGFAVAAGVGEGADLLVVARSVAGGKPPGPVGPGQAVRIMTGAPVPDGGARVVPFEWTTTRGDRVRVDRLRSDASHVVKRGAHAHAGDTVLRDGTRLDAGALAALATAGCETVEVAARPTVAVLGTGSELVPVGARPAPGQVRNSNLVLLLAQARRAGARAVDLGARPDDPSALRDAVREGLGADLLVLSGGVSRGDLDLVPSVLEAEGIACVFHRWAVQPGGPLWFGVREDTLVFGLPGNPAASFVGFEVLVVPALETRVGRGVAPRRVLRARYRGPWGAAARRRRYRPARLGTDERGVLHADAAAWRGSGDPFAAARAEALAAIPEDVPEPPEGDATVDVIPLEPLR